MINKLGNITLINDNCMNVLRHIPDQYFNLAIVDPPFGIGQNWRKDKRAKFYHHQNNFNDSTPGQEYFSELFRVSKNQIIWGCNYYWNFLRPTNNLIFWDKGKDAKTQHGSAGELAWTSFTKYPFLKYDFMWNGYCVCEKVHKIHPHQKPVLLYKQLLNDFASAGDKILDTFLGSGSIAIACNDLGFELTGIELDYEYFIATRNRLLEHQKQLQINF